MQIRSSVPPDPEMPPRRRPHKGILWGFGSVALILLVVGVLFAVLSPSKSAQDSPALPKASVGTLSALPNQSGDPVGLAPLPDGRYPAYLYESRNDGALVFARANWSAACGPTSAVPVTDLKASCVGAPSATKSAVALADNVKITAAPESGVPADLDPQELGDYLDASTNPPLAWVDVKANQVVSVIEQHF